MSASRWLVAAVFVIACGAPGLVACRQLLGVEELGVRDGGTTGAGAGCRTLATTEACYSCCANVDGGDQSYFKGDFHDCVCNSECSADCPMYCGPSAPADITDCDLCAFSAAFLPQGQCQTRAATAAQVTPGAAAIHDCLATCPPPSDGECAALSTLRGCYDCCEGKHLASANALFNSSTVQACVCDAGCAGNCPSYCPSQGVDVGPCTQCIIGSLSGGGCAATGVTECGGSDCQAMFGCMQMCGQTQ